ncbi:thiamine-phosphate kinase [Pseudoxanthomonas kalamensis DSM 18571]|uniref:thiamine-phosphate kinase n=1 Tax=Pseudoxanthomonas kalamensis TaxID=289483 RepID=UPI001391B8F5|nr:thiamine-phosphate kinase [Pseudoxanthomonas kalamensis]KAF1708854.1 thiamine-phosphate kinase [Pseudoxanthomonas kalamensis DSM 18571]
MAAHEFDLIRRIRERVAKRDDVVLGIGDDTALLQLPPDRQLAVTTDTLNAGVHFPIDTAAADIGWKALAVNLSDLAAMGAEPAWCTLSLSLPQIDDDWLDGFLQGFLSLAERHGVALVGGDTTRGPLSACVTAMGTLRPGAALRRAGAKVGDDIWVTGTLGDAAAALALLQQGEAPDATLRERLDRPTPRVAAGMRLAGLAHACVDVSDGLLADLGHVCEESGVGAEARIDALPASPALLQIGANSRSAWQAGGGDDYELCFTASPQLSEDIQRAMDFAETAVTRIGRIVAGQGARALTAHGHEWEPPLLGYEHFAR